MSRNLLNTIAKLQLERDLLYEWLIKEILSTEQMTQHEVRIFINLKLNEALKELDDEN
ncbi:MAG: hypothetical protein KAS32_12955 [Candidatus Peribacteraceae bacterium]|nr:hypothetical protein [Candidatus Peribacteraceae bacterium]